jgi:hypothetical protein
VSDLTNYNQDEVGSASKRSDKHCPKGKRECGNFGSTINGVLFCEFKTDPCTHNIASLTGAKSCPWPSRQVRVDSQLVDVPKLVNQEIERLAGKWNNGEFIYHSDLLIAVFAAGRAYQAGKDEKVVNDWAYVSGLADKDLLIAALDEAGKGE